MQKAIGMIETVGIANSIFLTDILLKSANVKLICRKSVGGSLQTVLIEGEVADIKIALESIKLYKEKIEYLIADHYILHPNVSMQEIINNKNLN